MRQRRLQTCAPHAFALEHTHTNVLQNETVNETDESADLCRFMFELCRLTELDTFLLGAGESQVAFIVLICSTACMRSNSNMGENVGRAGTFILQTAELNGQLGCRYVIACRSGAGVYVKGGDRLLNHTRTKR